MPQGENLRREVGPRQDRRAEGGEQSDEQRSHAGRERYQRPAQICNDDNPFRIFGRGRRHMKTIGYLGMLDRLFGVPVTTRNWNTIAAIVKALERTAVRG